MPGIDALDEAAALAAADTPSAAADALDHADGIGEAIDVDRERGRFAHWGASTVIDENTREPVLPRALFDALHERAALPAEWPVGNAGLLHCYGYLLSLAPTPYGLKRERWLGGDLARALGLPDDHFVPWHGGSTLLARATDAATGLLANAEATWSGLVEERVAAVAIGPRRGAAHALAYALSPAAGTAPLLVTMFPVEDADAVRAQLEGEPPRLRWNAV